jgi:glycerol-3-phosphate O-acyltransferase
MRPPSPAIFVLLATALLVAVIAAMPLRRMARRFANRTAARAVLRFRTRVDRFKLTGKKPYVTAALLDDEHVAEAVRQHAAEHGLPESQAWRRVESYVDEIVPFFNIIVYYKIGYRAASALLRLFYKVTVEYAQPEAMKRVPRNAVVVYLINHRSNADYLLVGYALSGRVAISYAVGEWARAFPLETIFKSFGAYFIRRRYREPLYHTVLERYVQLITRHGVTQGIFPEGGLTRDGRLRPAKIGLLDYILGAGRERGFRERMYVVPVALNYDRVLEDRSLLRELSASDGRPHPAPLSQIREVFHFVGWNLGRLVIRRWQRYGRASVVIGAPVPLQPWFDDLARRGVDLHAIPRAERLAQVQLLADDIMSEIGALVPVTPVPLACAAIQSLDRDFLPRSLLLERMAELRDVLLERKAHVARADHDIGETFDRAYRMLRLRRVLAPSGKGLAVLPHGRELVSYYANSIAHLLGPFEASVRARDALPVDAWTVGAPSLPASARSAH